MMLRVLVRSRAGNIALAAIGAACALASFAVLVWLVLDVWGAATFGDYVIKFALVGSMACGGWFFVNAMENLGVRWRPQRFGARAMSNPASVQR
jgi:hypothetical protein